MIEAEHTELFNSRLSRIQARFLIRLSLLLKLSFDFVAFLTVFLIGLWLFCFVKMEVMTFSPDDRRWLYWAYSSSLYENPSQSSDPSIQWFWSLVDSISQIFSRINKSCKWNVKWSKLDWIQHEIFSEVFFMCVQKTNLSDWLCPRSPYWDWWFSTQIERQFVQSL